MIKRALHDFLTADPGINAAVGGRVYDGRVPQKSTYPCIVLTTISTNRHYHLTNETNFAEPIIQVDVYDRDPDPKHDEIAELVRLRVSGYGGPLNTATHCYEAIIESERQLEQRPEDGSDNWIRWRRMDVRIFHDQPVPTH